MILSPVPPYQFDFGMTGQKEKEEKEEKEEEEKFLYTGRAVQSKVVLRGPRGPKKNY